ncbi:MAG: hypothetical protein CVV27_04275 [Candidatus Melainabacteria bacterium HGW-Melainabacteria-1]|nr:MAG: hypothetical protein CVV27_04275 [Candidatus Melainabacteria bacterium HGW-Melainabacteria-1]
MGNLNVNKPQQQASSNVNSTASSAARAAGSAAASAKPAEGSAHAHEKDPFLKHPGAGHFEDQIGKLPPNGSIQKPNPFHFNQSAEKTVDRVLSIGVAHAEARENGYQIKTPDVEFHLAMALEGMTPGEMDEVRDAIVDRMSSPKTSQQERDVLQRMYNFVDKNVDQATGIRPNLQKILDDIKGKIEWHEGTPKFKEAFQQLNSEANQIEQLSQQLKSLE